MDSTTYLYLLLSYVIVCCIIIAKYLKRDTGAFQAPLLFTLASLLMMIPQYTSIILNPLYDERLLWDLTFMMITGTIAFSVGFEKADHQKIFKCHDIKLKNSTWIFILMFLIGLYCTYVAENIASQNRISEGGDIRDNHTYQVYLFFRQYFDYGYFFALVCLMKARNIKKISKPLLLMIITGTLYYIWVVTMFARRALTVKLFLSIALLASIVKPKLKSKIKWSIVLFFSIGMVYNASISEIRTNLSGSEKIGGINIWQNYVTSFYNSSTPYGIDLYNGAQLIKHVKDKSTYNYGAFIWNDIVTWYFPSFIFGKNGKEELKIANYNDQYIDNITGRITTTTGYAGAFEAFGYLGFICFYALGYILGFIWKRAKYSSLYLILYMSLMYNIPNIASHGFNYILGNIETFMIFGLPLLLPFIYKKRINPSLNQF